MGWVIVDDRQDDLNNLFQASNDVFRYRMPSAIKHKHRQQHH